MAMAGLATGTEVDSSLLRTSRTCLELTAMGSSTGASERKPSVTGAAFGSERSCDTAPACGAISRYDVTGGRVHPDVKAGGGPIYPVTHLGSLAAYRRPHLVQRHGAFKVHT